MRIGLFGFPQTGKSTLFRLLTGSDAPSRPGRSEIQVGVTKVPDVRLDRLAKMYDPRRVTQATIEYLDLAGMAKGEAADVLPYRFTLIMTCSIGKPRRLAIASMMRRLA